MSDIDLHDEIERLEAQIDELAARIENCRKFILGARIAIVCGGALAIALLLGVVGFDARLVLAAIAAVLGGIVAWGSNDSTAKESAKDLKTAEADRAALIEELQLQTVAERKTLH